MNGAGIDTEIQVERLFVICLQKALDKHAPEQLEELSQWFDPGSRQMRFHIAPVIGAVGYLRKHTTVYQEIMRSAGIEASAKAYTDISHIDMLAIKLFPRFWRERLLKRLLQSGLSKIHREGYVLIQNDNYSLAGLAKYFSVENSRPHRALQKSRV